MTDASAGAAHLHVGEQFDDAQQQRAATTLGMWIFITTEVMFFGALFFAYSIARLQMPEAFAAASRHTNVVIGTANTAILLTSSFFMALAVHSAGAGARKATMWLLLVTASLGALFSGLKLTEYVLDYRDHLVPLVNFTFDPQYLPGARVFFGFYFATTALHLVHLSIGVLLLCLFAWRVAHTRHDALGDQVQTLGLYWHFVDIVWIFLYPCLYLVSRA